MKYFLVVALVAVSASYVFGKITPPAITKCDDDAISWVKVIWQAIGAPSGLVAKRAKDVKIGLIASSFDYDASHECEYAEFSGNSATWTLKNDNGETVSYKEDFKEDASAPGIVTSSGGKIKRYFVFSKGGVNAFYICSTDGPEGDPQGAVSVLDEKLEDATLNLADFAADLLAYVGVQVNETNVDQCFKK